MDNAYSIYCITSTVHGIASRSVKPAVRSDPVIHATVCVRSDRTDGRTKCNNTCNTNTSALVADVSLSIAWIARIPYTKCNNTVQLPQRL